MKARRIVATFGCVLAVTACGSKAAEPSPAPPGPALPARVSASIDTDHGPATLIVGPDAIYVGNHRGGSVQRVDPATNKVVSTLLVGGQVDLPVAADPSVPLWACTNVDGVLNQLDLSTGRVTAQVQANCDGGWRNVIEGRLWAVSGGDSPDLRVIDARTGTLMMTAPLDQYAGPPVGAGGRVLIGSGKSGITYAFTPGAPAPTSIAVETPWLWSAGGRLYRMPSDGALAELDPVTLAVVKTYTVPPHETGDPALVADDAGHLYYRPDFTHLYRVDIASGQVESFLDLPWEETPTGLAWGFGSLWVTNFEQDTIWRVNTTI
jgi:outer membrane protein assembly factor BamB